MSSTRRRALRLFARGAAVAMILAPARVRARDAELPSAWRRADVVVDGASDDWSGRLVPLAGEPLAAGVLNDGSFLYLCVRTSDEAARKKILGTGLSIYLDASGKDGRAFGVRFPVGGLGRDPLDLPSGGGGEATAAKVSLAAAGRDLEILGGGEGDGGRMRVSDAKPLEAAVGDEDGALVVELKVPLAFSVASPHAVEAAPGSTISLGLETAPPKRKHARPDEGRGGGRGGFGMGGGGMRGGRGGGPRGGRGGRAEHEEAKAFGTPLKVWLSVPLAREDAVPAR